MKGHFKFIDFFAAVLSNCRKLDLGEDIGEKNRLHRIRFWDAQFEVITLAIVGLLLLTWGGFYLGISITSWHWLLYLLITMVGGLFCFKGKSKSATLVFFGLIFFVHILSLGFAGFFIDLGGDGMATHQEAIIALDSGWNPQLDPYYDQASENILQHPELEQAFWIGRGTPRSFSYIYSSIIATAVGKIQWGKAVHLLFLWLSLCGGMCLGLRVFNRCSNQWMLALLIAFNPVTCYQYLSFWQDGVLAGVYSGLLASVFLMWIKPRLRWLLVFVGLSFVLSGMKKSGLGYAGLSAIFIYLIPCLRGGVKFKWLLPLGVINLTIILFAGYLSGMWGFRYKVVPEVVDRISVYGSEEISAGGSSYNQVMEYQDFNRWKVFLFSMASKTRVVAREIELKIPFTTDIEELKSFYYFFEDFRSGGFGPFYSGLLCLSVILWILNLVKGRWKTSIVALAGILIVGLPLAFLPTYWARWIPQMWLVPILLALPSWIISDKSKERSSKKNRNLFSVKKFMYAPWAVVFASLGLINVFSIIILYTLGNVFGSHMIRSQLKLIEDEFSTPVLYGHGSYGSNRMWLLEKGIPYHFTWKPEDWNKSYIKFYRTDTKIFVDSHDFTKIGSKGLSLEKKLNALKDEANKWQPGQWHGEVWVDKRKVLR